MMMTTGVMHLREAYDVSSGRDLSEPNLLNFLSKMIHSDLSVQFLCVCAE